MINTFETGGSERQFTVLAQNPTSPQFQTHLGCVSRTARSPSNFPDTPEFPLGGSLYRMAVAAHAPQLEPPSSPPSRSSRSRFRFLHQPHADSCRQAGARAGGYRQPSPTGRPDDPRAVPRADRRFSLVRCCGLQLARPQPIALPPLVLSPIKSQSSEMPCPSRLSPQRLRSA